MRAWGLAFFALLICLLGLALIVSCGDDDDDDDDDTGGGDDDDSGGGNCTTMCNKLEECLGSDFEEFVGTVEQCIEDCQEGVTEDPEAAECAFDCDVSLDCDEWMECLQNCYPEW